jgi:hypothetical protein
MPSKIYTHKNKTNPLFNKTRKNNTRNTRNTYNRHREMIYSEGFTRRMTEPISFTILNLSDVQKLKIDNKIGPILSDEEKWELYTNGKLL